MKHFIPEGFIPPERYEDKQFCLRKLSPKFADLDYEAIKSSSDIIHKLWGNDWPSSKLTFKRNLRDLIRHEQQFDRNESFVFAVLNPTTTEYLGCVYIYPPDTPWFEVPKGVDAVVGLWVAKKAYALGFYPVLFRAVRDWVKNDWPFQNVYYSNKGIPTLT